MKICFLASAESIHSYRWVKFFADAGHEVHWVSLHPSIFPPIPRVYYYEFRPVPGRFLGLTSALLKLRRLLKQARPEVIHAHYAGTYGLLGALAGVRPLVTTAWGSDILFAGKTWYKRPFIQFTLRRSILITTDAYHMIDAMKSLGVRESKIRLICFGIDTRQFQPSQEDRRATREKLNLDHSSAVISLRTLDPVYDVGTLVRAAARVLKEIPDAIFLIAGSGSQEQVLQQLAKDLGIAESVRFLGRIPNDQLPRYLSAMDAYVSTSLSDAGVAASTAEAMACSLPVVVTNSGENSRWIRDGENGFVVPVQEPGILAERIVALLKDRQRSVRFGILGRAVIQERNDYFTEMGKMEKIYREISHEKTS